MSKGLGKTEKLILNELSTTGEVHFAALLPPEWEQKTYWSYYRAAHSPEKD